MKLPLTLNKDSREPIYHQIEQQLKTVIASGQLLPGSPLPSIRILAKDLGVSVITTRRAYQNLEYAGFITTIQGKGTFVAEIDSQLKTETKNSEIKRAMTDAIQTALQYNYSFAEIEKLFLEEIKRLRSEDDETNNNVDRR